MNPEWSCSMTFVHTAISADNDDDSGSTTAHFTNTTAVNSAPITGRTRGYFGFSYRQCSTSWHPGRDSFFLPNTADAHVSMTSGSIFLHEKCTKSILSYKIHVPKITYGREKAPPRAYSHVY